MPEVPLQALARMGQTAAIELLNVKRWGVSMKPMDVMPFPPPVGVDIRVVPGWPGYYACSDGSVWSRRNFHGGLRNELRRLRGSRDKDGYAIVALKNNGKVKTRRVAHVILEVFIGMRPDGTEACHFPDPDITNNRADNLLWRRHSENISHKFIHGTVARGLRHGMSKLTPDSVREIRLLRKSGWTYASLGRRYGVAGAHIGLICKGKYWKEEAA
jgi:hypothetical protein